MARLTAEHLRAVEDAALAADLFEPERRPLLLAGLDTRTRSGLPQDKSRPRDQLISDLTELNRLGLLHLWLQSAARLSISAEATATFEDALQRVQSPSAPAATSNADLIAWLDAQLGRWQKDVTTLARKDPAAAERFRTEALTVVQQIQGGQSVRLDHALNALYARAGLPSPRPPTPDALAALGPVRGPESNSFFLGRLTQVLNQSAQVLQAAAAGISTFKTVLHPPPQPSGPAMTAAVASPADAVSIVVITALPKEEAAVRKVLDLNQRWDSPGPVSRTYHWGTLPAANGGSHTVAVVRLTDMGNNSAANATSHVVHHFPNARHLIMCGIAGGAPSLPEHDVRLGDIVVSDRNGVVQYDLIKERPDGSKEHRHPPRPPGADLLRATQYLQTEATLGQRPWEAHLTLGDAIEGARRPADTRNAKGEPTKYPRDPARRRGLPRVFSGAIAAADILLKNPAHRDYLRDTFKVKAIEMEGSGVADATWEAGREGYLVVRGICDYCDEHKGDLWQMPAAVAAAAYARAVIEAMAAREGAQPRP